MICMIVYMQHVRKANCGIPDPLVERNIGLTYNSTLEGSQLTFWCKESPNDTFIASCLRGGRWSVDLENYDCNTFSSNISLLHVIDNKN